MTDGRLTNGIGGARSLATPSLAFEWCHAHRIGGGARFLATPFCLGLLAASGGGPVSGHSRGSVWAFQLKDDGTRIAEGQKRQKVGGPVFWPRPNLHAYTVWEGNQKRQRLRGPVFWPHLGLKKTLHFHNYAPSELLFLWLVHAVRAQPFWIRSRAFNLGCMRPTLHGRGHALVFVCT